MSITIDFFTMLNKSVMHDPGATCDWERGRECACDCVRVHIVQTTERPLSLPVHRN
jgi:hypothetical protein